MKYFLLFSTVLVSAISFSQVTDSVTTGDNFAVPERYGKWLNDYQAVFSKTEKEKLDSLLDAYEKETSVEIVIVTFDSTWVKAEKFDKFVLAVHNKWGVGKKGVNNGIVIGFSTDLRMIRISNGYGIEKRISDTETAEIISKLITPEFRQGKYYEGIYKGVRALMSSLQ